ncbi:MAG: glycosyltransferase family 2 protein [Elusimicrobiota bacterium]
MLDLSITIVNYNTKKFLEECLSSIYQNTKNIKYEIIVVDNASGDGSAEMLKQKFPDVKLIVNQENFFFTKAHNQALKNSTGRYLLLLNPDTVILDNALGRMVNFMDTELRCRACGPKLIDRQGRHQWSGEKFPTFLWGLFEVGLLNTLFPNNIVKKNRTLFDWNREDTREVDSVSGACLLVRKEVIQQVGLLDENFTAYFEEIDWCHKIKKHGWKIFFVADAQVIHHWGVSMDKLGREKKEKIFDNSFLYYYRKHYGIIAWIILAAILRLWKMPVLKITRMLKGNR